MATDQNLTEKQIMKKNKNVLDALLERCKEVFPDRQAEIEKKARTLFSEYIKSETGKSKAVTMHTVERIYPCIAFYKAVSECAGAPERAYAIIDGFFEKESAASAKKLQKLCRVPFVYKLVPRVMASIIRRYFGTPSGFEMLVHETKRNVCHIDMIKCPYFSICSEQGCTELTTVFCNSDDIAYGNMHDKLSWERKKTLGRGDECCDFILRVKKR